jgi:hypothetical protein
MRDFFGHLAERALGAKRRLVPEIPSRFAPWPGPTSASGLERVDRGVNETDGIEVAREPVEGRDSAVQRPAPEKQVESDEVPPSPRPDATAWTSSRQAVSAPAAAVPKEVGKVPAETAPATSAADETAKRVTDVPLASARPGQDVSSKPRVSEGDERPRHRPLENSMLPAALPAVANAKVTTRSEATPARAARTAPAPSQPLALRNRGGDDERLRATGTPQAEPTARGKSAEHQDSPSMPFAVEQATPAFRRPGNSPEPVVAHHAPPASRPTRSGGEEAGPGGHTKLRKESQSLVKISIGSIEVRSQVREVAAPPPAPRPRPAGRRAPRLSLEDYLNQFSRSRS